MEQVLNIIRNLRLLRQRQLKQALRENDSILLIAGLRGEIATFEQLSQALAARTSPLSFATDQGDYQSSPSESAFGAKTQSPVGAAA
jgi:hypothetical protein